MISKFLCVAGLLISVPCSFGANKERAPWQLIKSGTRGTGKVVSNSRSAFKMTLINSVEGKNYATALSQCDINAAAQKKIMFRCRGSKSNISAYLTPMILVQAAGKKWKTYRGPRLKITNSVFRNFVMGLDSDFHLSDSTWNIRQIKFAISNTSNVKGKKTEIEITDFRLADADDTMSAIGSEFIVVPAKKSSSAVSSFPGGNVKIFFDFDNDDLTTRITNRKSKQKDVIDNLQTLGFRAMLLEPVSDLTKIVDKPSDADVIVYSRAATGKSSKEIVEAVKAGKGLIVFGGVHDPEIAKLLPVTVTPVKQHGFAQRQAIKAVQPDHPVFKGVKLNPASFGIYQNTTLRKGKILNAFANGMPAVVEGKYGKGNVIYCATGIGNALVNSSIYHDAFALRLIFYLAGTNKVSLNKLTEREQELIAKRDRIRKKLVDEVLKKAQISPDGLNYQAGMSFDNFGRFGWLIGEGLLCDDISRKLSIGNGLQEYCLSAQSSPAIPLIKWDMRPISGAVKNQTALNLKQQDYRINWSGAGVVEYTTEVKIPKEWQGKKIFFSVEKGIDDLDEVEFNGLKIGSTDKNTPHYWQAPRSYKIPAKQIRFGQNNKVKVLMKNLKGQAKFNSCPRLCVANPGKQREELSVTDIDWAHKTYLITNDRRKSYRMVLSLLLPFILYDFNGAEVTMKLENLATHASWSDKNGIHTVDLQSGDQNIFDLKRNGKWTASWLLLWRQRDNHPLLLAFERQPRQIKVIRAGKMVNGLVIDGGKSPIGRIVVGRPWGVTAVNTVNWRNGPDKAAESQITRAAGMALRFPVKCDEIFAVGRDKIKIISRFQYESINDDWKTSKPAYAFLPPLAGLALQQKKLVSANNIMNFGMPTKFGPLVGRINRSTVSYELPRPDSGEMILPNITTETKINREINKFFAGGVRWSAGGRTRFDAWSPARPAGKIPVNNIDMFGWCLGLGSSLQGMQILDDENKSKLRNRVRIRFSEPVECYQYKSYVRFRKEPFSGLCYPVFFNSYFPNETNYAPGFGSKIIYGDENEACTLVAWVGRQLADRCGQADLVRTNWNFFRQGMRYMLFCDDWAFNSGSCREFGVGSWIDMLNCEYACMCAYAGLAETVGDIPERNHALYRAAKRMLPTLMRWSFQKYLRQHAMVPTEQKIGAVAGFRETDGARLLSNPPRFSHQFRFAMDMFDFSQGFPSETVLLYKKYVNQEIREYLGKIVLPTLSSPDKKALMGTPYLPPMAFWGPEERQLRHFTDVIAKSNTKKLMGDWPGIRTNIDMGTVIYTLHPEVYISKCRELDLRKAVYNPENRTIELEYQIGESASKSELKLRLQNKPVKMTFNGKALSPANTFKNSELVLPVMKGLNKVVIQVSDKTKSQN